MKQNTKALLKWGLLVLLFLAVWQILSADAPKRPPTEPAGNAWWITIGVVGALVAAFLVLRRIALVGRAHRAALAASAAHVAAGRYEEAERAIEALEKSRLRAYRLGFHFQRAEIAARRGDRDEALARIAPVFAGASGGKAGAQMSLAYGLRAFLRASAGDAAGAREDIGAIRAAEDAWPAALARAALAEAMLLDREDDRAALRDLLERSRPLVLAAGAPRERALWRAYEAMVDKSAASVYRQKGDRVAAGGEAAAIVEWAARYAPNAAPFVCASVAGARGDETARVEAPSEEARRRVDASRTGGAERRSAGVPLALWTALIVWGVGMYGALSSGSRALQALSVAVLVAIFSFWIRRSSLRQRGDARRIERAARAIDAGDLERASAELSFEPESPVQRAQAARVRAEAALRRGDMSEALAQSDLALQRMAEVQGGRLARPAAQADGGAWDFQRLVAGQRAFALAALGRGDDAWAEIEWANGFPDALPIFRVRLFERLSRRDFTAAARAADERHPAMILPARDEALADVTRFAGGEATRTPAEAARLRAELRRDRDLARWIDAVAPGLLAAFERAAAEMEAGHEI